MDRLDGNAIAGLLGEVLAFEPTSAWTVCAGCGAEAHLGALPAYTRAPGAVLRCVGVRGRPAADRHRRRGPRVARPERCAMPGDPAA